MGSAQVFSLPTRIVTGLGCSRSLDVEARLPGERALLVCSPGAAVRNGYLDLLLASLEEAGVAVRLYGQVHESKAFSR